MRLNDAVIDVLASSCPLNNERRWTEPLKIVKQAQLLFSLVIVRSCLPSWLHFKASQFGECSLVEVAITAESILVVLRSGRRGDRDYSAVHYQGADSTWD